MTPGTRIYICDSHRPKIPGGGCCNDKGSQSLIQHFRQRIQAFSLGEKVELITSSCLSNCRTGITVRVWPDQTLYGRIKLDDVDRIIEEHLIGGSPVKDLEVVPVPRFQTW